MGLESVRRVILSFTGRTKGAQITDLDRDSVALGSPQPMREFRGDG
jgi:hypothetical protein